VSNLIPSPGWSDVVQLELLTRAKGGPGGEANAQAQALLNRLELLKHSRVVLTVAELRLVDGSVHKVAFSAGGAALGDGDGGWYWVDDADTSSTDDGDTIIVGTDGKRSPVPLPIPDFVSEREILQYLDDMFHERATPERPSVVQIMT